MLYALGQSLSAVAISPLQNKKLMIYIPEGAIVEIPLDAPECGIVEAIWEGRSIEVFAEDVRKRGSKIRAAHS